MDVDAGQYSMLYRRVDALSRPLHNGSVPVRRPEPGIATTWCWGKWQELERFIPGNQRVRCGWPLLHHCTVAQRFQQHLTWRHAQRYCDAATYLAVICYVDLHGNQASFL